ncbi:FAD-linked oxidase [Amylibacter ulvae]|uniref:FAD-linked oxidase n=1 Tax=Paramylibacter ulvae TaxID=1651968 RepID=A0ABQ3DBG1_9RHOB|nr:FAD-binding and (Fe-S)-binding domain-containing protein [Amylibacter ulvae]GHA62646.1 FAD-linked oxidase [Amylibacter ulvae]
MDGGIISDDAKTSNYPAFIAALIDAGFAGEISQSPSIRTIFATDNSIYQIPPDGVAFPRDAQDLILIMRTLDDPRFADIVIRPRGGGTGTNGQSLGDGLVVDCSRHMCGILEINADERWVRVEPGVIKDQLNAALAPYGLFFAPELSTSSRATIGGMISTDACGQGSCAYGKTSDHVLALDAVLLGGEVLKTAPRQQSEFGIGRGGEIHRVLDDIVTTKTALIQKRFPKMNRSLTGYDLAHIKRANGGIDAASVICGSEGTLALIAEAKLNVLPIPKAVMLVNVFYDDFDAALKDAPLLSSMNATSVETMDSRVLALAREDIDWINVAEFFPDQDAQGVNMVEFTAQDADELGRLAQNLIANLHVVDGRRGFETAYGSQVAQVWNMRKKAVGLLGRSNSARRSLPFVEDCAVPPDQLAPFIRKFRTLLDDANLDYGMFGHVDAGVLHVRPALDLVDPADEPKIRKITEQVVALAHEHGGLLWGEHGKGLRSEFVPDVFGDLYPCLQDIKRAFDPRNQLNPGKIASPNQQPLTRVDEPPLRAHSDRQIDKTMRHEYMDAMACNGNGACFAQSASDVMCPSYKATKDRRYSPKGRAGLIREWLRQGGPDGDADPIFEAELKQVMDGCLSCRACASACPIQVDVPKFRAKFMQSWYKRHRRPLRDYVLASLETLLPVMARVSILANVALTKTPLPRMMGLTGLPAFVRNTSISLISGETLRVADDASCLDPNKSIVIVPDAFTQFFEPSVIADFAQLAKHMGFDPWLAPYRPSGKPLHVLGWLSAFEKQARSQAENLRQFRDSGIALIGVEPAITLAYASDYQEVTDCDMPDVLLAQEWLLLHIDQLPSQQHQQTALLFGHCTEKTQMPNAAHDWGVIFQQLGVTLGHAPVGCCGMAGTWGHLSENESQSAQIFQQSWQPVLDDAQGRDQILLATGFSCRCQAKKHAQQSLLHPISYLQSLTR